MKKPQKRRGVGIGQRDDRRGSLSSAMYLSQQTIEDRVGQISIAIAEMLEKVELLRRELTAAEVSAQCIRAFRTPPLPASTLGDIAYPPVYESRGSAR